MKMFVAQFYPMSVEDPETGSEPEVIGISEDVNKLVEHSKGFIDGWDRIEVVNKPDVTLLKAGDEDEMLTYIVISEVDVIS